MSSIFDWSKIAGNNDVADAAINWQENQIPSTVNNSARQMMGRVAEFRDDIAGALTTTNLANAYALTTNSAFTTLMNGRVLAFRASAANTGAATLNVNAIGSKEIRCNSDAGDVALPANMISANGVYVVRYSTTAALGSGGWILENTNLDVFANPAMARTNLDLEAFAPDGVYMATGDVNTILKNGFYQCNPAVLNLPSADWYSIRHFVNGSNATTWGSQYAIHLLGRTYQRFKDNGVWQPWQEVPLGVTPTGQALVSSPDAATARTTLGAQAALGFPPLQQGGGAGQLTNKIYIGWDGGKLKAQVDATDLGGIYCDFNREIPAGTRMVFYQATAPTGWTQVTGINDRSLRVVDGAGGANGGAVGFSTVFGRTATDAHVLTGLEMPSHTHTGTTGAMSANASHSHAARLTGWGRRLLSFNDSTGLVLNNLGNEPVTVDATNTDHTHNFTTDAAGSGNAFTMGIDLRVTYIDVIVCSRN